MTTDSLLRSVVAVRATIPDDAFTASGLGTKREGSGVVIGNGLVLTIGYLITEATQVWLTTHDGRAVPAHVAAYDQETGFGLLQPLGHLDLPGLEFGDSEKTEIGDKVTFGIRPEHIGITESAGVKLADLRVDLVEQLGDTTMVYASTMRGQPLTIALEGQRHISPGTTLPTYIDPARYHVFGPDGLALQ